MQIQLQATQACAELRAVVAHAHRVLNALAHRWLRYERSEGVHDHESATYLSALVAVAAEGVTDLLSVRLLALQQRNVRESEKHETTGADRQKGAHRGLHRGRGGVSIALELVTEVLGGRLLRVGLRRARQRARPLGSKPRARTFNLASALSPKD